LFPLALFLSIRIIHFEGDKAKGRDVGWSRSMHGRSVERLQIILQRSEVSGSL